MECWSWSGSPGSVLGAERRVLYPPLTPVPRARARAVLGPVFLTASTCGSGRVDGGLGRIRAYPYPRTRICICAFIRHPCVCTFTFNRSRGCGCVPIRLSVRTPNQGTKGERLAWANLLRLDGVTRNGPGGMGPNLSPEGGYHPRDICGAWA